MTAVPTGDGIHPQLAELVRLQMDARRLLLASRRRSAAARSGQRPSRRRGRGIDFEESRQYLPGDETRHIDWRVTARTGQTHTKIFSEERDRPVHLLLDANPSMFFGTRIAFKSIAAVRLAALLGWLTVLRGDRIGALLFNREHQQNLPPAAGRRGVQRLLSALLQWYQPRTDIAHASAGLAQALQQLQRTNQPGGMAVLVSDGYAIEPELIQQLAGLRRRLDMVVCQILDPLELTPPPPGHYPVSDGQHTRLLDTGQYSQREQYQQRVGARHRQLHELLRFHGIPLLKLTAADDPVQLLRRQLDPRIQ